MLFAASRKLDPMRYFSEREDGELPRDNEVISTAAWSGIRAIIKSRLDDGSFGKQYPLECPYDTYIMATNKDHFWSAMQGYIPRLRERPWELSFEELPETKVVLDTVEFCWDCIAMPERDADPCFFSGRPSLIYHIPWFNTELGHKEFRQDINKIFSRNRLAYQLTEDGHIERLPYTVLSDELKSAHFRTGDEELDDLLEKARVKFLDSDEEIRREALEELWDAWERLKTLKLHLNKREGIKKLLDRASGPSAPKLRSRLETEASELTGIGNELRIRHSETSQEMLVRDEHIDYLFHRLFSLIQLILKTKDSN